MLGAVVSGAGVVQSGSSASKGSVQSVQPAGVSGFKDTQGSASLPSFKKQIKTAQPRITVQILIFQFNLCSSLVNDLALILAKAVMVAAVVSGAGVVQSGSSASKGSVQSVQPVGVSGFKDTQGSASLPPFKQQIKTAQPKINVQILIFEYNLC
ncbi:hypothetical protein ACLKA6_004031 [Drosophila palustris]